MLPLSWTVSCTQRVTAKWVRMKPSAEPLEARAACSLAALHAAYLVDSANLARAQVGLPALTVNPGLAADARKEARFQARHGYRGDDGFPQDVPVYPNACHDGWLVQNAAAGRFNPKH